MADDARFNSNLVISLVLISIVVGAKLFSVASATDNWRGFAYSMLHVVIVALGGWLALRRSNGV